MGYCTIYNLTVTIPEELNEPGREKEREQLLRRINDEVGKMRVFGDGDAEDGFYVEAHWYDYDDDMRLLSARIRDVIFLLGGEGESVGDIWKAYYCNGKSQFSRADIVFEEFDKEALMAEIMPPNIDPENGRYSDEDPA